MRLKERPFKDWIIDRYHAKSPDNKYMFWIASGYMFFRDEGNEQLLGLLSFWEKRKVWKALKNEMKLRVSEIIEELKL